MTTASGPSPAPDARERVVRTLKDGYWDRTEVVQLADGSLRVRKSSKGAAPPGPWGVAALRREIEYLSTLPAPAGAAFPPVLARWDDSSAEPARVGYEMPFYAAHVDAGELARQGALEQAEIDVFQDALADLLLERVYGPMVSADQALSNHVANVVEHALQALEVEPAFARLIGAPSIRLNGTPRVGTRAAFARVMANGAVRAGLDAQPQVRLHGDLFLENVLWRSATAAASAANPELSPRLLLIDPVSVAGVVRGPPLFDLVKYLSYATGELPALRAEWLDIGGFDGSDDYSSQIRWQSAELAPFRERDWHTRLRRRFEAKYGRVDARAHRLLDGYFSVAMAVNTGGVQRRARLLKATLDFNAAGENS